MSNRPIEELKAGNDFRDSLVSRADAFDPTLAPLWHGWVIVDAFLAGIDFAKSDNAHAEMLAAVREIDRLMLVIETAVRTDQSSHLSEVFAALKACAAIAKAEQVRS
jgi:hypothetical protein